MIPLTMIARSYLRRLFCCSLPCYIGIIVFVPVLLFSWNLYFTSVLQATTERITLRFPVVQNQSDRSDVREVTSTGREEAQGDAKSARVRTPKLPCDERCRWEREQNLRKDNVKRYCSATNQTAVNWTDWLRNNHDRLHHLLVSDTHRIFFCYVPKVSCTNWKKLFFILNGVADVHNISKVLTHSQTEKAFWRMSNMAGDEIIQRLEKYTSFLFVRNPFTRILSAYKEKFEIDKPMNRYFRLKYTDVIFRAVHGRPYTTGQNVSFADFVRYLGNPKTIFSHGAEEHWIPVSDMCFPCQKQYDYIGKLETLEQDAKFILETFHLSELRKVVLDRPRHFTNTNVNSLYSYFSKLKSEYKDGLKRRYMDDLSMFGYHYTLVQW